MGLLSAYTDKYEVIDSIIEPYKGYSVFRMKRSIMGTSDIGLLFSGTLENEDNYNYAVGIDGVYRKGASQLIVQGATSKKNEKQGFAFTSGFHTLLKDFRIFGSAMVVQDSFDVSDIGFVPWVGMQRYRLFAGPFKTFSRGFLRAISANAGIRVTQEPGDSNRSYNGLLELIPEYRNRWGNYISFSYGKQYEVDTNYIFRSANLNTWGNLLGQHLDFGCWYGYTYNYLRGFPAYRGSNWFSLSYSIMPNLSTGVRTNLWIEWDTTNTIISMMPSIRPNFFARFTADMSLSIFSEFVMTTPGSDLNATELYSVRPGLLFTWNFRPKSWLYIALNDYKTTIHEFPAGDAQTAFAGGGIFTLRKAKLPFLTIYIRVDDIEAKAKKIEELGGFIVIPPQEVFSGGPRICLFNEPSGVTLAMIQRAPK
jgi:predicted enzyme related to lactoylglutathione lyase